MKREESFYLADAKGTIKATIGDIIIFTADERNNTLGNLTSEIIKENQIYKLTIHVDADYLKDPKTAYPIRIDPTIEVSAENNSERAIDDVTFSVTDVTQFVQLENNTWGLIYGIVFDSPTKEVEPGVYVDWGSNETVRVLVK